MTDKKKEGIDREADMPDEDVAPTAQEQAGANLHLEQTRGTVFGDNTSAGSGLAGDNNNNNVPGLHGRDGGFSEGTPNNPAPIEEQVDEDATKDGDAKGEVEKGIKTL